MDLSIKLCRDGSPEHRRALEQLEERGVAVPAGWRPVPAEVLASSERRIWLQDSSATEPLGMLLGISRSRRVPWARIARMELLGNTFFAANTERLAALLLNGASAIGSVMRCEIRVLHRQASVREALIAAFEQAGARRVQSPTMYRHTSVLEVNGTAADMAAQLPPAALRRIRQPLARGLLAGTNTATERDIPRLLALMDAVFARTGGHARRNEWARDLTMAVRDPDHNPLATLEYANRSDPERIVAFALGAHNGDHITYRHGAAQRKSELGSLPLGYAPLWHLVEWGVARGVAWVDLGGISTSDDPAHPLAGITAFKRQFGGVDTHVADEVSLELSAFNGGLERTIGRWLKRS